MEKDEVVSSIGKFSKKQYTKYIKSTPKQSKPGLYDDETPRKSKKFKEY